MRLNKLQSSFSILKFLGNHDSDTNHANNVTKPDTKSEIRPQGLSSLNGNRDPLLSEARTLVWWRRHKGWWRVHLISRLNATRKSLISSEKFLQEHKKNNSQYKRKHQNFFYWSENSPFIGWNYKYFPKIKTRYSSPNTNPKIDLVIFPFRNSNFLVRETSQFQTT